MLSTVLSFCINFLQNIYNYIILNWTQNNGSKRKRKKIEARNTVIPQFRPARPGLKTQQPFLRFGSLGCRIVSRRTEKKLPARCRSWWLIQDLLSIRQGCTIELLLLYIGITIPCIVNALWCALEEDREMSFLLFLWWSLLLQCRLS